MADFPYVLSPSKIPKLLSEIKGRGRPTKLNRKWLEAAGLKSKNDRAFRALLTSLGYLASDGTPTPSYDGLRGSEAKRAASIAQAVKKAYRQLFTALPDAPNRSNQDLSDYFSAETGSGGRAVGAMVGTFKALCEVADFGAAIAEEEEEEPPAEPEKKMRRTAAKEAAAAIKLSVNLSLELPATDNADVYDKIFAAVAKHLRDLVSEDGE